MVQVAVGDRDESATMVFHREHNAGSARITERGKGPVRVTTIDALITDPTEKIGLIKLDVQDFEMPALRGARGTIDRHRPLIVAECVHDYELADISKYLRSWGYRTDGKNWARSRTCIWESN